MIMAPGTFAPVPRIIVLTQSLMPASDNIGTYSCYLADYLGRSGLDVAVWVLASPCRTPLQIPCTSFSDVDHRLFWLISSLRREGPATVIWQYNPFSYGLKGFPGIGCLIPVTIKVLTKCKVVVVFHEISVDAGRNWKHLLWFVWHHICLWLILLGTDVAITTNVAREQMVARFAARWIPWPAKPATIATIPVGPLIPIRARPSRSRQDVTHIGAFVANIPAPASTFLRALQRQLLNAGHVVHFDLFGIEPGATRGSLKETSDSLSRRGYVPADALSDELSELDIFLALPGHGASGRHSSLTHAFAHGLAVISTDARDTDHHLYQHDGNCLLVPRPDLESVTSALIKLCDDAELRYRLGEAAYVTYTQHLSWPAVTRAFLEALG